MANQYRYQARNQKGQLVRNISLADSPQSLAKSLLKNSLIPIDIELIDSRKKNRNWLSIFNQKSLNLKDQVIFSRQMYALIKAGIPILRGLSLLIATTLSPHFKDIIEKLMKDVESGLSLSDAMQNYETYFSNLMIALVRVGESAGKLENIFKHCALHYEKKLEHEKKVKSAMRYPNSVLVIITMAFVIINVIVIPSFVKFFKDYGAELPIPTQILMISSSIFLNYWPYLLICLFAFYLAFKQYLKVELHKIKWEKFKIRLPILGSLKLKAILARFSRTFSLCFGAGIPVLDALTLTAATADNHYIKTKILQMAPKISKGGTLSEAVVQAEIFDPIIVQMFNIGEESGQLSNLLDELSQFYDNELEYDIKKLTDSIEPIMISVIACLVLILALGIFLPMWDISNVVLKSNT